MRQGKWREALSSASLRGSKFHFPSCLAARNPGRSRRISVFCLIGGNLVNEYSQRTAAAASTGGTRELSFRPGQPRRFLFGRGPFFRNTPGPARPAAYYRVCITRGRFFQDNYIFKASFALKSANFISKKGVDAKSALPPVTLFRFFGKIAGILSFFKNNCNFPKNRPNFPNF